MKNKADNIKITIKNLKELEIFAENIAKKISECKFLGLSGDLGAGKTQFTKFFVKALGGNIEEVVSPTFTILNEYFTSKYKVYHFDLYRLNGIEELEEIGYEDFFYGNEIVIVEWVDKIPEAVPAFAKIIKMKTIDENQREIEIIENGGSK
jgi:tRNA threonylcarbamoyladenosine biosynthesis protein TsaE